MSDTINGVHDSASYHPRLCHLTKWDDFNGYGFNLHAEKGKAGQYIGKVDDGSPAVAAKLRQGDRIVEVNGVNIGNENHQQVVQRIKAGGEETKLLVVDAETDLYFKEKKIVVRGEMEEVIYCKTPPTSEGFTTEEPVHVNSNHTEAETLNHNEETVEIQEESKDIEDGAPAPVVVNGVTEEPAPVEPEPVEEIKENGIYDTIIVREDEDEDEDEVIVIAPEPVPEVAAPEPVPEVAAPEPVPEVSAPEPVPEVAASEPVPEVAAPEPEPEVVAPEPEPEVVEPEPEVVAPEPVPEVVAPEPEPAAPEPEPEPEPVVAAPAPEPEVVAPTPEPIAVAPQPPAPAPKTKTDDPLDFGNVSVEEMKKRIQSKKKVDTRFSQMGLREKYDLLQRL